MKDTKIKYKGYCFKLNEITLERLKKIHAKQDASWNITFKLLIDNYETIYGRVHNRKKPK